MRAQGGRPQRVNAKGGALQSSAAVLNQRPRPFGRHALSKAHLYPPLGITQSWWGNVRAQDG